MTDVDPTPKAPPSSGADVFDDDDDVDIIAFRIWLTLAFFSIAIAIVFSA
jgi:hypothetical protein